MKSERNVAGPNVHVFDDLAPEGRRSASEGRFCERCKGSLRGRKERFCSDACRMAARRERQSERLDHLLTQLAQVLADLRSELGGDDERD